MGAAGIEGTGTNHTMQRLFWFEPRPVFRFGFHGGSLRSFRNLGRAGQVDANSNAGTPVPWEVWGTSFQLPMRCCLL